MPVTIHYDNGTNWVAAPTPQGKLYLDDGTQWLPVDSTPELAPFSVTQSKVTASGALVTTLTGTLNNDCTAGRLLIADLSVDKQATAITVGTGWTLIQAPYSNTSVSKAWAYRIATGTSADKSAQFTWSSARGAVIGMMETNLLNAAIVGTPFVDGTEVGASDRWFNLGNATAKGLFLASVSLDSLADAANFTWDNGIELLVARGGAASGSIAGTIGGFLVDQGAPMTAHVTHPNDQVVSMGVLFSGTTPST